MRAPHVALARKAAQTRTFERDAITTISVPRTLVSKQHSLQ